MLATARLALIVLLSLAAAAAPTRTRKKKPKLQVGTLEHFAEFCRRFIVLDNGQPFELEKFQRLILAGYFAGVTELLVLLPKKNGKTTLLAAVALYHLIYTPNAACYIAASAKDQAAILYEQACGFLERTGPDGKLLPQAKALQKRVRLLKGYRKLESRRDSGFIRVISGDKDTGDGVIPTLALVDELHRHKDGGQLYGVLADGLGPRNGQIITISTAGETMKSALGRARTRAYEFPGIKRRGAYVHVRSPNGEFELHEWSLRDEDDRENLTVVKRANPLASMTIERLEQRKASPHMTPSRWARFACGVWMQGEDAAYSSIDWSRNAVPGLKHERGTEGYIGLDIGWRWDTTAIVFGEPHDREELVVCPDCESRLPDTDTRCSRCDRYGEEGWWRWRRVRYGKPRILVPPRNGKSLRREAIIKEILAFRDTDGLVIRAVIFDRNAEGENIAQELEEKHGITVIDHSQAPSTMAAASMGFGEALGADEIEHPDDPEFSAHVLACKAKTTTGESWRIVPPEQNRGQRKKGKQEGQDIEVIDAAVGAVMLHRTATALQPPEINLDDYRMEFID